MVPPLNREDATDVNVALGSRVIIIEGISGSGKNTFQKYLGAQLKNREVYSYTEGELLQSWKQLQIKGVFNIRLKFMRRFLDYVKETISRDERAVFLLNRFHLSAYVSTVVRQPKLEKEYNEILTILRTLPVHVFILQLEENEIEKRSSHPERSAAWRNYQKQIVKEDGFRDNLQRHIWQQVLIQKMAATQGIPYSILKLPSASIERPDWVSGFAGQSTSWSGARLTPIALTNSRGKRRISETV